MTERSDKKYEDWNNRDTIRYMRKVLKSGKEHRSNGWAVLTPDDIAYLNKKIIQLKSELLDDPDMFMSESEIQQELKKLDEADVGEFELCDARCCNICGNFVREDLDFLEYGKLPDGEEVFECPFCGSWNRSE